MKITWEIEAEDINKVKAFFNQQKDNYFVKARIATNLKKHEQPVTKAQFWQAMISCLLTTQQRSSHNSPVGRFSSATPFALSHKCCLAQASPDTFITKVLTKHGGIRRSTTIGREAKANLEFIERDGWKETCDILERVRRKSSPNTERHAARFIDKNYQGFGPKQSRNLLQELGLSRYEIPIDSRITKWLNEFGFPVKLTASGLADQNYYEFISDGFQQLAKACGIYPCVLDSAIFSSFDSDV